MCSSPSAQVPVSIWIVATFGLICILIAVASLHTHFLAAEQKEQEKLRSLFNFETERLQKIGDKGLIVVGTSLTQHGFPFDTELSSLAGGKGILVNFVRFSRSGEIDKDFPSRQNYRTLMPEILKSHPRWIFIQAETFFLGFTRSEKDRKLIVYKWTEMLRAHLRFAWRILIAEIHALLLGADLSNAGTLPQPMKKSTQDDTGLNLDNVRQFGMIRDYPYDLLVHPPVFPDYIEEFIRQAKQQGISVILLEMNRSKEGNEHFGTSFRAQLTETLQEVSERYQIPYWQFRGDLSLDYYYDWAHLNRKGRTVFTDWFLMKFAQEYCK